MKTKVITSFLLVSLTITSCWKEKSRDLHIDLSKSETERVHIKRYEKAIFSIDKNNIATEIKRLTPEYPFFLSADLDDTLKIIQMNTYLSEPRILEIYYDCIEKYPEISDIEAELTQAFAYIKHYYPEFKKPEVFTYVSDLYYERPVIYLDSILLIALDMYLGADYKYYPMLGIPVYQSKKYTIHHIVNDCVTEIAKRSVPLGKLNPRFLDRIVYEGKLLYFIESMLPDVHDSIIMGYSARQETWCHFNEANLWKFFIDKKLLFETDKNKTNSFISPGPFTTGLSKDSPARTGNWAGWQIIRSYMNTNRETPLRKMLLENDAQKILSASKYKPTK